MSIQTVQAQLNPAAPVLVYCARNLDLASTSALLFMEAVGKGILVHRITLNTPGIITAAAMRRIGVERTFGATPSTGTNINLALVGNPQRAGGSGVTSADLLIRTGPTDYTLSGDGPLVDTDVFVPAAVAPFTPLDLWRGGFGASQQPIFIPSAVEIAKLGLGTPPKAGLVVYWNGAAAGAADAALEVAFSVV